MTTTTPTPRAQIAAAVTRWPGVTVAGPGERGELSFMLGRREIGHLHGDHAAHFAFQRRLGAELRAQGRVGPHPITDAPSLGARRIEGPEDVRDVIDLMRLNYEWLVARHGLPDEARRARAGAAGGG